MQIKGEPLNWIGDNQRKRISAALGVTISAGPQWSRKHFEDDEAKATALAAFLRRRAISLRPLLPVVETSLIRWRYGWVTQPHPGPCLVASEEPCLVFAGHPFGEAKVEGATL